MNHPILMLLKKLKMDVIGSFFMQTSMIVLFILSIIPSFFTFFKIKKKLELNVFDILTLFSILYYVLIPIKCVLGDVSYREEKIISILNNSGMTLVYICIAFFIFLTINIVITNSSWEKFRCLKTTENFKIANNEIDSSTAKIVLYAICFAIVLFFTTNYKAISDDAEYDRIWRYAQNVSFIERCVISFVSVGFPVFWLLTLRQFFEETDSCHKMIKKIALLLGFLCIVLGARTQMLEVFVISIIYVYSCYREKITKKLFFIALGAIIIIPVVLFPLSQQLRIVKLATVQKGTSHDFSDVLANFANLSTEAKVKLVKDAKRATEGRSANVFIAFNDAVNNSYVSTNGEQLWDNLLCVNPLHKPSPSLENINAEKLKGDWDIAESLFTVMYVDLGATGMLFITPFLFAFISSVITFLCSKIAFFFRTKELMFLPIVYILQQSITIEKYPLIRTIYNPTLITMLMFGVVFYFFNKFSKA